MESDRLFQCIFVIGAAVLDDRGGRLAELQRTGASEATAEQRAELAQLARVGGGDEERGFHALASAARWASKSCTMPWSASASRELSASRPNVAPSAVPCTSTY